MEKEKDVVIYNEMTGKPMCVPESHVGNYVGKGWTLKDKAKAEGKRGSTDGRK